MGKFCSNALLNEYLLLFLMCVLYERLLVQKVYRAGCIFFCENGAKNDNLLATSVRNNLRKTWISDMINLKVSSFTWQRAVYIYIYFFILLTFSL